jgi:hypothetical protein
MSVTVRVEDSTSIGRAYSAKPTENVIKGLGARRRDLRCKTFNPQIKSLESFTLNSVNLATATRADVLAYFRNTWDLTSALFSSLRDDSIFYSVPGASCDFIHRRRL